MIAKPNIKCRLFCVAALILCACTRVPEHCSDHNPIDPFKQFCHGDKIVEKCGGKSYDPATQFCYGAKTYPLCGGSSFNPDAEGCYYGTVGSNNNRLTVYIQPDGGGTVTVNPDLTSYEYDAQVNVKAIANGNYTFSHWEGAATGDSDSRVVTMGGDRTVTAVFIKITDPPIDSGNGITDTYKTAEIGGKVWMAENLNINTGKSWCYGNNDYNCLVYGRLYDWETAMTACPAGWHLSSNDEWDDLAGAVGGYSYVDPNDAGGLLFWSGVNTKLKAQNGWNNGRNGTDNFQFSALPGGAGAGESFSGIGVSGSWWTATDNGNDKAYVRVFYEEDVYEVLIAWAEDKGGKDIGHSVRCVKGTAPSYYRLMINVSQPDGGGSTVSRSPNHVTFESGTHVTVTANTVKGSIFSGWTGDVTDAASSITVTMDRNMTLTATFELLKVNVDYDTLYDDRDGQEYKTVVIGGQTWMAENLDFETPSGSGCAKSDCDKRYGRWYNWATAMDIDTIYNRTIWEDGSDVGHRGICPEGWHLPSSQEWDRLVDYVGSESGRKLKSTSGWYNYENGTDDYGFSALGVGGKCEHGSYISVSSNDGYGHWWTSTQYDDNYYSDKYSYCMGIDYNSDFMYVDYRGKNVGQGVRCVKDD